MGALSALQGNDVQSTGLGRRIGGVLGLGLFGLGLADCAVGFLLALSHGLFLVQAGRPDWNHRPDRRAMRPKSVGQPDAIGAAVLAGARLLPPGAGLVARC